MVNDALVSELLIVLFTGMVGFVIMRRGIPRSVELALWIGLVWVCVMGVTSTHDKQTRALTAAAVWGSSQIMGTIAGLTGHGIMTWTYENRMTVADWVILLFGVDLLVLVLLRTHRMTQTWRPRVWLRDWMEIPRPGRPQPAPVPVVSGVDELNERFNKWAPDATAGAATTLTLALLWALEVIIPAAGRKLRSIAAGTREVIAEPRRVTEIVDFDSLAGRAASLRGWAGSAISEAASAQQFDWMGGYEPIPPQRMDERLGGVRDDGIPHDRDRRDRLAS